MRMRGVEKNISSRGAKFTICQPEVCAVPGVVVAAEGGGGGEGEGGVRQWVSGMSVFLSQHSNMRFFAAAAARPDNKSFPTAPSGNLVIPANNIWRC